MLKRTKIASTISVLSLAIVFGIGCGKTDTQTSDKLKDEKNQTTQPQVRDTKSNSNPDVNITKTDANSNKTDENKPKSDVSATNSVEVQVVKLPTMQCSTCKKNITKALKKVDGISDFDISVDAKIAKIKFDKSKTDLPKIENAITAAGYDANDKKADPTAYENLDDCCKLPKDRK